MICREGKVSGLSFLLATLVQQFGVSEYGEKLALLISESVFESIYALIVLYFIILVFVLTISFKSKDFQVSEPVSSCSSSSFSFVDCY